VPNASQTQARSTLASTPIDESLPGGALSKAQQVVLFGFALPRTTPAQRDRAAQISAALAQHYPHAHCELVHTTPCELLVATILSAQATDVSVNKATPALFARFKSPAEFAASTPEEIEPYIRTIGLFRSKAKSIHVAMTTLVEQFGGEVPRTMAELLTLRGVARKTAGVVLGNCFKLNRGFVVDTHVHRLSQRLRLVRQGANVQQTERQLMSLFPVQSWCDLSHRLIFHGRYACTARNTGCSEHPICQSFGVCGKASEPAKLASNSAKPPRPAKKTRTVKPRKTSQK
jgi:endonuclease III